MDILEWSQKNSSDIRDRVDETSENSDETDVRLIAAAIEKWETEVPEEEKERISHVDSGEGKRKQG